MKFVAFVMSQRDKVNVIKLCTRIKKKSMKDTYELCEIML